MRNWAGNLAYSAGRFHQPESVEQLQQIVRASRSVRALGSRHSFSEIADTTGDQVSLARLPRSIEVDAESRTVTVDGGIRYGELCGPLHAAGFALHNLASLPHISVAGACATATHGSGDRSGNLATAVSALELVTADGDLVRFDRAVDTDTCLGAVVSLGALGIVTKLTLDMEPTYQVRQDVYEDLPLTKFADHFEAIASGADSVSFFTEWGGPSIDMVWQKRRVGPGDDDQEPPPSLFGATPAVRERHPIRRMAADACTAQLGVVGPWHERLPHFRMDHTPSAGAELQTEYLVPREHAVAALLALDELRSWIAPLIQVSEIRTVAADALWLSTAFGRASVALHFTWIPDLEAVRQVLPEIEAALRPYGPRPHWGKLFATPPDEVRVGYERLPDFVELAQRHDPNGKFRNAFVDRYLPRDPA